MMVGSVYWCIVLVLSFLKGLKRNAYIQSSTLLSNCDGGASCCGRLVTGSQVRLKQQGQWNRASERPCALAVQMFVID